MKAIKNIRLKDYNYKTDGYYLVTICANYGKPYFEDIEIKNIIVAELARLNELKGVKIDYYVLMPNHIHLIIVLDDSDHSLFEIVKRFKSKTTVFVKKLANQGWQHNNNAKQAWQLQKLWQPNYYEHVIRNERALLKIREYIQNNPEKEFIDFKQFYEG